MPTIGVVTERVEAAAAELAAVSGDVTGAGGWMPATAGAAEGTEAAGAYEALVADLAGTLPAFARAADGLAQATARAAECYRAADVLPAPS